MSTVWRAEKGPKTFIAAVCSYVPVSWLKFCRVVNFALGPQRLAPSAGGHTGGPRARGARPQPQRGAQIGALNSALSYSVASPRECNRPPRVVYYSCPPHSRGT